MQTIESVIRSCWDHYAFDDATFLSEVYFAETASDLALHLLATSYYRSGQRTSAYLLLKSRGVRTPETKYLFAKCCEDVENLSEAESTINENYMLDCHSGKMFGKFDGFGASSVFVLKLLGRIFSRTNRIQQSVDVHKQTLDLNPYLFTSFSAAKSLGDNVLDPDDVFHPPSKFFRYNYGERLPARCDENKSFSTCNSVFRVSENKPACADETPNGHSVLDIKNPPKAPRKQPSRRIPANETISNIETHPTSRIVTRQRSNQAPSVLNQSQARIRTRRSDRLFQNSLKENELSQSTRQILDGKSNLNSIDKLNSNSISTRTRLRKNENKIIDSSENKNLSSRRDPLIEKLCKLDEETTNSVDTDISSQKTISLSEISQKTQSFEDKRKEDLFINEKNFIATFVDILKQYAFIEAALLRYDFKKIVELIEDLPDKHKHAPWALTALGKTYFELADYAKAIQYFDQCRQRFDYFVKGAEYHSAALWHLQKESDLSALAQEMIEKHPHSAETWCVAGNCFSLEKEQETAIKFFQRAIQLDPQFSYAYTLLGHEYIAVEESEKAIQAFRSALKYQPRNYNAWYGLGLVYYKDDKIALANIHFARALKINPRNAVLLCNMSLVQQGEARNKALEYLNEALMLSPKNALCRYHKAQMLFSDERYDEALDEVKELKQLAPKEPLVYFLAGKIHKKLNEPHLALMNFSWATELDPRGEQHHHALSGGDRRYDDEPVTALAALESDETTELHALESDESS